MDKIKQYTRRMVNVYLPDATEEEKQTYAEEFCEGNEDLKNFLLFLWHNNINTIACCGGHKYEPAQKFLFKGEIINIPEKNNLATYVLFSLNIFSISQIEVLVSNILFSYFDIIEAISFQNNFNTKKQIKDNRLAIHFKLDKSEKCYKNLENLIQKLLNNELDKKTNLLNNELQILVNDILMLYNLELNNYFISNTFNDVNALRIGINNEIEFKGISWQTLENSDVYNSFRQKQKNKDNIIFDKLANEYNICLSKNTYFKTKNKYFILKDEKFFEVDENYIKQNNIMNYLDYIKLTSCNYSHETFVEIINAIKNHNIFEYAKQLKMK